MLKKNTKDPINGVLLLDKALGVSSNTALQQVRRVFNAKKAGHTGVLDPLATGLLPVCFGEATKFAQYLLDADKAYIATLKVGEATTTADAEGEVIETAAVTFSATDFADACAQFTGTILQKPPMYSALKFQGKSLYEYARQGIEIERKQREVTIYGIEILSFELPIIKIAVSCSKGTYIRTLAEDLAKKVGSVAHLIALRRTKTAGFNIESTYLFEQLAKYTQAQLFQTLLPCDVLVAHLPEYLFSFEQVAQLKYGQNVQVIENYGKMQVFRIYDANHQFIGLAEHNGVDSFRAVRLMNTSV
ncbi:tRNA pseudouridine(55) synthase TruB [Neisseria sp. Ec49-e6-T10]|uniref:tRNA pseudouridine(55) synthase TruB n=1 Tax=Neisseria sp. Ec49-e6-T10 TaxID=3140744 RepID=UPI003EB70192